MDTTGIGKLFLYKVEIIDLLQKVRIYDLCVEIVYRNTEISRCPHYYS